MTGSISNALLILIVAYCYSSMIVHASSISEEGRSCGGLLTQRGNVELNCYTQGSCSETNFNQASTQFSDNFVSNINAAKEGEIYTITWGIGGTGTTEVHNLIGFFVAPLSGSGLNLEFKNLQTCQHLHINSTTILASDLKNIQFNYTVDCAELRQAFPSSPDYYFKIIALPTSLHQTPPDYRVMLSCAPPPTTQPPDGYSFQVWTANFSAELSHEIPWNINPSIEKVVFVLWYKDVSVYTEEGEVTFHQSSTNLSSPLRHTFPGLVPRPSHTFTSNGQPLSYNYYVTRYLFHYDGAIVENKNISRLYLVKGESYARLVNESRITVTEVDTSGKMTVTLPVAPESFLLQSSYKIHIQDPSRFKDVFNDTIKVPQSRSEWLDQQIVIDSARSILKSNHTYMLKITPMGNLSCSIPDHCIPNDSLVCAPCRSVTKEFTAVFKPMPDKPSTAPMTTAIVSGSVVGGVALIALVLVGAVLFIRICRHPDVKPRVVVFDADQGFWPSSDFDDAGLAPLLSKTYPMDAINFDWGANSTEPEEPKRYKVLLISAKVVKVWSDGPQRLRLLDEKPVTREEVIYDLLRAPEVFLLSYSQDTISPMMRAEFDGERLFYMAEQLPSLARKICGPEKAAKANRQAEEELHGFIMKRRAAVLAAIQTSEVEIRADQDPVLIDIYPGVENQVSSTQNKSRLSNQILDEYDFGDTDPLRSAVSVGYGNESFQFQEQFVRMERAPDAISSRSLELSEDGDPPHHDFPSPAPDVEMEHSGNLPLLSSPKLPNFRYHDNETEPCSAEPESLGPRSAASGASNPPQPIGKMNWSNQAPKPPNQLSGPVNMPPLRLGQRPPVPPQHQQSVPDSQISSDSGDFELSPDENYYLNNPIDEHDYASSRTVEFDSSFNLEPYQLDLKQAERQIQADAQRQDGSQMQNGRQMRDGRPRDV